MLLYLFCPLFLRELPALCPLFLKKSHLFCPFFRRKGTIFFWHLQEKNTETYLFCDFPYHELREWSFERMRDKNCQLNRGSAAPSAPSTPSATTRPRATTWLCHKQRTNGAWNVRLRTDNAAPLHATLGMPSRKQLSIVFSTIFPKKMLYISKKSITFAPQIA